ncbi:hypothetical protein TNCV_571861 [Trichonephila clavipes]|nr:hypothetical protein TNCV_571861 [Trichonephila clavipes]
MKKDEEGNAGRVGWGEPREGVEGTERTRSGRRGPQAPQRRVIQNPHFSTTHVPSCQISLGYRNYFLMR